MLDFALAMPVEVCAALGERTRQRRVALNLSIDTMAERTGLSARTLSNFERTGKCTLETFVRILEMLGALPDLQKVLVTDISSIAEMRQRAALKPRKRAYPKARKSPL